MKNSQIVFRSTPCFPIAKSIRPHRRTPVCVTCGSPRFQGISERKIPLDFHQKPDGSYQKECIPRSEPLPGETYTITRPGGTAFLGGEYEVKFFDASGKFVESAWAGPGYCERLLIVRGHQGPFPWS